MSSLRWCAPTSVLVWSALVLQVGAAAVVEAQFIERINLANPPPPSPTPTPDPQANESSFGPPAMSADGRFVAFTTLAGNLLGPGVDSNGSEDVYVADLVAGTVERVSVSSAGVQGNNDSGVQINPVRSDIGISDDGNLVTFTSIATNLIDCMAPGAPSDCGGAGRDLFLHDRRTGITRIQNVSQRAGPGIGQSPPVSEGAAISGDGRYVAFIAGPNPLVDGDLDEFGPAEVYLRQVGGQVIRASVDLAPDQGILAGGPLSLSNDGKRLVFMSASSTLVAGDTNNQPDIFLFELTGASTGTVSRVSVADDETEANGDSRAASISGDGRYVVFFSAANDLTPPTAQVGGGVYIRDLLLGTTRRITGTGCVPPPAFGCTVGTSALTRTAIGEDGRWIAFDYTGNELLWPDDNTPGADIYLYDQVQDDLFRISVNTAGGDPNFATVTPAVSDNGPLVAFTSFASDLVGSNCGMMPAPAGCDTNNRADVFLGSPADALTFLRPIQAVFNGVPRSDGEDGFSLVARKELVVRAHVRFPKALGAQFDAVADLCVDGDVGACGSGKSVQATGQAWAFGKQFSETELRNGVDAIDLYLRNNLENAPLTPGAHTFQVRVAPQTPGAFPEVTREIAALLRGSPKIEITGYPVHLSDAMGATVAPDPSVLPTLERFTAHTYPVDDEEVTRHVLGPEAFADLPAPDVAAEKASKRALLLAIARRFALDGGPRAGVRSFAAGVLPRLVDGVSPTDRTNSTGFTARDLPGVVVALDRQPSTGAESIGATIAHELGHQLGFGEEYCTSPDVFPCAVDGAKWRAANPPPGTAAQGNTSGNYLRPAMEAFDVGELVPGRKAIFGPPGANRYGFMGANQPEGVVARWVTPTEYSFLYQLLTTDPPGPAVQRGAQMVRTVLFVSGLIHQNGTVSLAPLLFIETDADLPQPTPGSTYTIEVLDAGDQVIATVSFDLTFEMEDFGEETTQVTVEDEVPFSLHLELPDGATSVRLREGATPLAEVEKSANAPMVAWVDVVEQAGNVRDLEWMGSDLDGGELTYTLLYSPNGMALETLAMDLTSTTFSFDLDDVTPVGFGAFLRVRASDGWNTAEDDFPIGPSFAVLDVDANGAVQALTDGLLVLRHLFGLTGTALTGSALGAGCTRCVGADITTYLGTLTAQLDVDGNGARTALTDGLLVVRHLFGLSGTALTGGVVGGGCTRCDAASIVPWLQAID